MKSYYAISGDTLVFSEVTANGRDEDVYIVSGEDEPRWLTIRVAIIAKLRDFSDEDELLKRINKLNSESPLIKFWYDDEKGNVRANCDVPINPNKPFDAEMIFELAKLLVAKVDETCQKFEDLCEIRWGSI